jgi:hypothetical protein
MATPEPRLDLLRPRSVGELLTTTVALFARHSGLFLSVTLLVVAPVIVLVEGVWGKELRDGPHAHASTNASTTLALITVLVIPPLVTGLHAVIVRELGEGRVLDVGAALRDAAPRFPAAIGAVALFVVGVVVGFVLLVIPGIWLSARWYFAAQAAVLEGTSPRESLNRSAALVDGRWWSTFGALLAAGLTFGLVSALAQAVADSVHQPVVYITLVTVIQAVALSLSALFGTLLFFTRRAEREVAARLT